MSRETLTGLSSFLLQILSKEDIFQLINLLEQDNKEYDTYEMPYTDEELVRRAEEGRRQIEEGRFYTNDEVFKMLEKKYELEAV